ncbi:MAG: LD-carboxypeptidase [Chitinophagales bacterium]
MEIKANKKRPATIERGDKIGILSTARKITQSELAPALKTIEEFGFVPILGKSIGAEDHQFAGTEAIRAKNLQDFIDDPEIKAILCARGGYGTAQLLDKVDFSALKQNPKWIIGYSDITALHLHLNKTLNIQSMHASMPLNFKDNSTIALSSIFLSIQGVYPEYNFPAHPLNKTGSIEAELIGGNLSVIYSLQGGMAEIDCKDKILFLEDLDEYLYHIDRMMLNLKLSGKLQQLEGMIIGGMTDMNDNAIPFGRDAERIISDYVKDYDYPVAFNCPAGHIDDNRALIMGSEIQLRVKNSKTKLKFL